MLVGIINYGAGNIGSIQNCLERKNISFFLSSSPNELETADVLLFPGVGNARFAMEKLTQSGLDTYIRETTKPLVGICLGMQLLYEFSCEGDVPCLGVIPGTIQKIPDGNEPVPHMGWNTINASQKHDPLVAPLCEPPKHIYFVHSYYCPVNAFTRAFTEYNTTQMSVVVHKKNYYGLQFHPEKSGDTGEQFLLSLLSTIHNEPTKSV